MAAGAGAHPAEPRPGGAWTDDRGLPQDRLEPLDVLQRFSGDLGVDPATDAAEVLLSPGRGSRVPAPV